MLTLSGRTLHSRFYRCHFYGTRCHLCNCLDAKREIIFSGPNTQKLFGEWLFNKERSRFTAVAHNSKSYNNYFFLSYLVQNGSVPKLVYNGSKIMLMHLGLGFRQLPSHATGRSPKGIRAEGASQRLLTSLFQYHSELELQGSLSTSGRLQIPCLLQTERAFYSGIPSGWMSSISRSRCSCTAGMMYS